MPTDLAQKAAGVKRTRSRGNSLKIDKEEIANRIFDFYQKDDRDRTEDISARLQRYAKYRQWTEGRDWIGEESSDAAIPDMTTTSLRIQDTLHNAVMSQRPTIVSKAESRQNKDKQESIDNLIDSQIFVEQNGEKIVEELAENFVNDGVYTAFIPWINEKRKVTDLRIFDPIPDQIVPEVYFKQLLSEVYPQEQGIPNKSGWDWKIGEEEVSFYTKSDGRVEMISTKEAEVFNGPRPIVLDYDDVLHPHRAANLQAPSPSNPGGASHVIIRDFPIVSEIKNLKRSGYYDLLSEEDLEKLENVSQDINKQEMKRQKDDFQGTHEAGREKVKSHKGLTRLICFDLYDIDGDGIDEDVIWWMILETKTLLKAKIMTEMYPAIPPRRPFAEASLLPVKGRRNGISILEMMEGLHDLTKQIFDQMVDNGTLTNSPFGFYRANSSIKQETIRLWAGELYPVSDPKNDVFFPSFSNQSQAFGVNMVTLIGQMAEKLSTVGDLQLGRVPAGKASALRTVKGMQTVLAQGEARPERILRRFFMGLTEIWKQIHELNQRFLPEKKKFMILGYKPDQDPYREIKDRSEIEGRFKFDFGANILNTSKTMLQESLNAMMMTYVSPIAFQLGIVTPENVYRLFRDFGKSLGQDPDNRYLTPPTPGANKPKILAEEAITMIMDNEIPQGDPMEGPMEHLQKLQQFQFEEIQREMPFLDGYQKQVFAQYFASVIEKVKEQQRQAQLMAAAQQFGQQGQAQPGGQMEGPPMVQENELLDESLPTAGGGGNV